MTDPLAYESGQDHQLDVYEVLALVNEDAFAGVKSAAEQAAPLPTDEGDLGYDWDYDLAGAPDDLDPAEYAERHLSADYDLLDDDDFTFLPDYLRERG